MSEEKHLQVFTDGSYKKYNNNKIYCGYGIYFPNRELRDVALPLNMSNCTNQRAELYAIYDALKRIKKNKLKYDKLTIYTDSEYSIKCFTVWYRNWELNEWKNSKKEPVMNQDIIKPVVKYLKKKTNIFFQHVASHTGRQDFYSTGNMRADELANTGAYLSAN